MLIFLFRRKKRAQHPSELKITQTWCITSKCEKLLIRFNGIPNENDGIYIFHQKCFTKYWKLLIRFNAFNCLNKEPKTEWWIESLLIDRQAETFMLTHTRSYIILSFVAFNFSSLNCVGFVNLIAVNLDFVVANYYKILWIQLFFL